jgi:hypothetical protein
MERRAQLGRGASLAAALLSACSSEAVFTSSSASSGGATTGSTAAATITASSAKAGTGGSSGDGGAPGSGGFGGDGGAIGGGGATTTDASASSSASSTSSGCASDCGDRRCGVDTCGDTCGASLDTWSIATDSPVLQLVVRPESSDLFAIGDASRVDRVDLCTGEVQAENAFGAELTSRGAGLVGDELFVAFNDGATMEAARRLERVMLEPNGLPIPLPADPDRKLDLLWGGVAHDGALWLTLDQDGDGLLRVGTDGSTRRYDAGSLGLGRGLASTPFGLVHQRGDTTLALVDTGACDATSCPDPAVSDALPALGWRLAATADQVFLPTVVGEIGSLSRVSLPDLTVAASTLYDVGDGLDAFLDAAPQGDTLFVSGVTGGLTGRPWVLVFSSAFEDGAEPILETFVDGPADVAWAIAVDDLGVYVAGSRSPSGGFVMKCTASLECPDAI